MEIEVYPYLRVGGIEKESIVDGPGFRYTLFTQGCKKRCPGCHNAHLQEFDGGKEMPSIYILNDIKSNPILSGVTFSGGEPFEQSLGCAYIGEQVKLLGLSVVTFTGYTIEEILASNKEDWMQLLNTTDILVDDPYKQELRDISLEFRGSSNQRVIDVKKTLDTGQITLI